MFAAIDAALKWREERLQARMQVLHNAHHWHALLRSFLVSLIPCFEYVCMV